MTAQRLRRWDTDERGHGVASASRQIPAIQELTELSQLPDWVAEDPESHLLPGLRHGAESTGLTITSFGTDHEGCFTVSFKGAAGKSRRDLRQAAWTIIGAVAELSSHVHESKTDEDVTFDVVTGMPTEASPFATHGHTLKLIFSVES